MIMDFQQHIHHALAPKPSAKYQVLSPKIIGACEAEFDQYMHGKYPHAWIRGNKHLDEQLVWFHALTGNVLFRVVTEGTGSLCSPPTADGVRFMVVDEADLDDLAQIAVDTLNSLYFH